MSLVPLDRPADVAALLRRAAAMPDHPAPPTREARMRRDPLPFIADARREAARGPALVPESGPFDLVPDDPAFRGRGWWPAERTAAGALRWTGAAPRAVVLLPALGGGALVLTLTLRAPFGIPLDPARYDIRLDDVSLSFEATENDGVTGRFAARTTIAPMPAFTRIALLIEGDWHADPGTGPQREPRRLGLALHGLRLERA